MTSSGLSTLPMELPWAAVGLVSIHRRGSAFGARDDGEADDLVGPANPGAAGRSPARSGRRKIGQLCDQRALYWLSAAAPGQDAVRSSVARSVWAALDSNQRPLACQAFPPERCALSVAGRAKLAQLYGEPAALPSAAAAYRVKKRRVVGMSSRTRMTATRPITG